jgi:hypothetical protein
VTDSIRTVYGTPNGITTVRVTKDPQLAFMDDVLAKYTPDEVAKWYGRLADFAESKGGVFAPQTLRLWLNNRDPKACFVIEPHSNLTNCKVILKGLEYHRRVYLTEEKASFDSTKRWVGLLPRIQGWDGFTKWDGQSHIVLNYQGLVEFPTSDTLRFASSGLSDGDRDVFTSFHSFQLRTDVETALSPAEENLRVEFVTFTAKALDRYDWDPKKYLPMPNPDHGVEEKWAIRPDLDRILVYHRNAKRVEAANLAAPYDLETRPWTITAPNVTGPAALDPKRNPKSWF